MAEIAVTGASGFVGRRLVEHLKSIGQSPIAISRRPGGAAAARHVLIDGYGDVTGLARQLRGVESLIHLAARAHQDSTGTADTQLFKAANVQTTLNVAQACMAAGVRRLVFVSSIGVNGSRSDHPFTEEDAPAPSEPYAISKWEAERALTALVAGSSMNVVILRPPLVYGPGCPGNFGRLVRWVASSRLVPLGALAAPRTFVFLDNLVDALVVAARHPDIANSTFLVADSSDVTVGAVVRILAGVLQPNRRVVVNVPPALLALGASLAGHRAAYGKLAAPLQVDASAFFRATDWQPAVSPQEGLRATARHFTVTGSATGL